MDTGKCSYPTKTLSSSDKDETSIILSKKEKRCKSWSEEDTKLNENKENINVVASNNMITNFYKSQIPNISDKIMKINRFSRVDMSNPQSSSTMGKKSMVSINKLKIEFSSSERLNEIRYE